LTNENNTVLLKKIAEGDKDALEKLVCENMGLVKSIALRFMGRGAEIEDLIQIGSIGMIKASRSFDFSYNTKFSTYAVPLIIGEIRRFLRDDGQIKVSRQLKRSGITVMKASEEFIKNNGREPTLSELSSICNMPAEELTLVLEAVSPVQSLNESVGSESNLTFESMLADKDNKIDHLTESIALREAVSELDELSRKIIHLRYTKELSQQQTGSILGISQVKVSRTEKKIMQTLREAL